MGADNRFRNATWNDEIASQFEAKLRRARQKEQYIRIQASTLARSHPRAAHALLDRYFETSDTFDRAAAHVVRANAYLSEGNVEKAIASYEAAIQRESEFPKMLTQAYIDLPYLVAVHGVTSHYSRAIDVLHAHRARLMFPVDHFKWHAAQSLIAHALGDSTAAATHATSAIAFAAKDNSGFRYHPGIGLVSKSYSDVRSRLQRLSNV